MAEFCKQYSKALGAPPGYSDFAGMEPGSIVLCEGCGHIQIGYEGQCISPDCLVDHVTGKERKDG